MMKLGFEPRKLRLQDLNNYTCLPSGNCLTWVFIETEQEGIKQIVGVMWGGVYFSIKG